MAEERAVRAASDTGDPLAVVASHFRLAHTLLRLERRDDAAELVDRTIDALRPLAESTDDQVAVALYGALHLVRAVIEAQNENRSQARAALDDAERIASRLDGDRNDFDTEFGPTNVGLHRVAIAVDLGDAGEAIEIGEALDATGLSHERQMRLHLDLARAYHQRRRYTEATAALAAAHEAAPDNFSSHPIAHRLIGALLDDAAGDDRRTVEQLGRTIGVR